MKKQTYVALSTTEAEFIAMSLACKELVSIKEMCLRIMNTELIPIMCKYNSAVIKIAKSYDSQSLKHVVKLCYHYIWLEVLSMPKINIYFDVR